MRSIILSITISYIRKPVFANECNNSVGTLVLDFQLNAFDIMSITKIHALLKYGSNTVLQLIPLFFLKVI